MVELSVIIPTRNRVDLLKKAIDSIELQTLPKELFEVIIVDNGSSDNTALLCEQYEVKYPGWIRRLYDEQPGLHVGRHAGMRAAKADILVYGDDDIEAFPTWLEGVLEAFSDSRVVLVGGNNLPAYEKDPPLWLDSLWGETPWGRELGYYSLLDFGDEVKEIPPGYVWGCNFSIRKSTLIELGGFHPDAMPDELLRYRGDGETAVTKGIIGRGYKALFNPKASVYHFVPASRMTIEYLYKRSYAQGISDSYTQIRATGGVVKRLRLKTLSYRMKSLTEDSFDRNYSGCLQAIKKGGSDGFYFHQNQVLRDPELLKWVLKDNYIDIADGKPLKD